MVMYLHLVRGLTRPETTEDGTFVGVIQTIGPLATVAESADGTVHLVFCDPDDPHREWLDDRKILRRNNNRFEFAGDVFATFIINTQRSYP
jgi:hypothetical protein